MSKGSSQRRVSRSPQPRKGSPPQRSGRAAELERARNAAASRAGAESAARAEGVDPELAAAAGRSEEPPPRSAEELDERHLAAWEALKSQQAIYDECARRATEREQQAAAELERAVAEAEALRQEREQVTRERETLDAQTATVRQLSVALDKREKAVAAREIDAAAGFPARLAVAEEALQSELAQRRQQAVADIQTAQQAHEATLKIQREALAAEQTAFAAQVAEQSAELDRRRQSLATEQAKLTEELSGTYAERVSLRQREQLLDKEVEVRAAGSVQQLETDLHLARAEAVASSEVVARLAEELAGLRARWAAIGFEDPQRILAGLDELRRENQELHDKLADRLDDDSLDRLRDLEQQNRDLNGQREQLRYELQEERGRQLADRISNLQVTQLADAQQQFDIIRRGYETRIAELRGTLGELVNGRADPTDPMFPNCVALDEDSSLQDLGLLHTDPPDLHQLARDLQGRMWNLSGRAYHLNDVCCVLGGLAMSRLHLLEGRSGIGKTSLPIALAAALHTECAIIEVQAGWRDRYDLFGHYNSFERRFQEEPFLLALYKASTPRYRDKPFFVVLDEMNLARPEQYFSVLLSKLETEDPEPIRLTPVSTGRKPTWLDGTGTGIALPDNVWFIGTANQDESTLEFADKTYNRSFVLELPAQRPRVPGRGRVEPYSAEALRTAFDEAKKHHRAEIGIVQTLLKDLADDLYDVGRVQVDPRLERQLEKYVPVVVAARGTEVLDDAGAEAVVFDPVTLAADQFIASKVLHQLHSRFEVTTEGISKLEETLDLYWSDRFGGIPPTRCRKVLADERHRRAV